MKNVLTATATIAALFAGSAAFAEGGYVDELGYINAKTDVSAAIADLNHENANAQKDSIQYSERGQVKDVAVTLFVADQAQVKSVNQGR